MNAQTQNNSTADHDLLIRLDQKVESLTKAITDLNDNTLKRLDVVEKEKADRVDIDKLAEDLRNHIRSVEQNFKDELAEEKQRRMDCDKDIETRMRTAERFMYISVGVTIIIQIVILPIILHFVLK